MLLLYSSLRSEHVKNKNYETFCYPYPRVFLVWVQLQMVLQSPNKAHEIPLLYWAQPVPSSARLLKHTHLHVHVQAKIRKELILSMWQKIHVKTILFKLFSGSNFKKNWNYYFGKTVIYFKETKNTPVVYWSSKCPEMSHTQCIIFRRSQHLL